MKLVKKLGYDNSIKLFIHSLYFCGNIFLSFLKWEISVPKELKDKNQFSNNSKLYCRLYSNLSHSYKCTYIHTYALHIKENKAVDNQYWWEYRETRLDHREFLLLTISLPDSDLKLLPNLQTQREEFRRMPWFIWILTTWTFD